MKPHPDQPILVVLAGPNGAGKSTFYDRYLSTRGIPFVNADRIAMEQFGTNDPLRAPEAARIADELRRQLVAARRSFVFETVLSDPVGDKVAFFKTARDAGYFVEAHFIGLSSSALSVARVTHRVTLGGHDVPDEKLHSRFPRTLENLARLLDVANHLTIYDNSEPARPHRPVALLENGALTAVAGTLPDWLASQNLPARRTETTRPL
jgi:predicted ABC-type ATPase